jgi:hypothetical protein
VGRDHHGHVPAGLELERQVVHVLGDATQLGVVVVGDERNPHRAVRVLGGRVDGRSGPPGTRATPAVPAKRRDCLGIGGRAGDGQRGRAAHGGYDRRRLFLIQEMARSRH